MLSLESSSSRMNRLARQELRFGTFHSVDEMLGGQIDGVASRQVEALIHRLLDREQLCPSPSARRQEQPASELAA